jgi:hypothetical protein
MRWALVVFLVASPIPAFLSARAFGGWTWIVPIVCLLGALLAAWAVATRRTWGPAAAFVVGIACTVTPFVALFIWFGRAFVDGMSGKDMAPLAPGSLEVAIASALVPLVAAGLSVVVGIRDRRAPSGAQAGPAWPGPPAE